MSSLAGNIDFAKTEEDVGAQWKEQDTFKTQNRLSKERGDEVRNKCYEIYLSMQSCFIQLCSKGLEQELDYCDFQKWKIEVYNDDGWMH